MYKVQMACFLSPCHPVLHEFCLRVIEAVQIAPAFEKKHQGAGIVKFLRSHMLCTPTQRTAAVK